MTPTDPMLVVSNAELPELEALGLDENLPTVLAGETHALALLDERTFAGLIVIVDGPGPLHASRRLIESFLRTQADGYIAVLSARNGDSTAGSLAYLPARVDVFFAPWDAEAIGRFLRLPSATPVGG